MKQLTESKRQIWGKIFWSIIVGSIIGVITGVIANHVYWVLANQNKLYYTISYDDERTRFTLILSNKTKKDIEQLEITLEFKDKLQRARIFPSASSLKPTEVELDKPSFSHTVDVVPKDTKIRIDIDSQSRYNSIKNKPTVEGKYSVIAETPYKIWTVEQLIIIIGAIFIFVIMILVILQLRTNRTLKKMGARP